MCIVTMDNDDVSQESIVIFINELGIWVVRVSGNLGCNGRPNFGGGRFVSYTNLTHQTSVALSISVLVLALKE